MHIDISVGENAIDYQDLAHKQKLSALQLRATQLVDQVQQIGKEQDYQRVSHRYIYRRSLLHFAFRVLGYNFVCHG